MAGLGHRAWIPGEVITADNIQQYLMDQSVQVYANSAARGSALVGFVAEGMVSYLKDTNAIEKFDGSDWLNIVSNASPTVAGVVFGLNAATNTFYGVSAGSATTGSSNTFIGANAGKANTFGIGNVAVGLNALQSSTTPNSNTAIGSSAAANLTTGATNTVIGNASGAGLTTGADNVAVGNGAQSIGNYTNTITLGAGSNSTASNQITLGNSDHTVLRCAVTSITALSDKRDKKDIVELPVGLQFVKDLKPVKFTWNQRDKEPIELADGTKIEQSVKKNVPDFGFIAQDLVKAEDSLDGHDWLQLTLRNNPDQLEATQGRLIPILVKAIQELSAEVDALKAAQK
jgi:hypothetical protein